MSTARSIYRRVRRAVRCAVGRDIQFPVQTREAVLSLGGEGAAWSICPTDIGRDSVIYSVGIGTDISFDLALIERFGVTVHAFDPTPKSIAWLQTQQLPARFRWQQVGLAAHDGQASFFPPDNPSFVSHTMLSRATGSDKAIRVDVRRLSTLMRDLGHDRLEALKMDIEGAEYDVVDDIIAAGVNVKQLLIEFHHRFPDVSIDRTRQAVTKLNAAGYRIFSVSDTGEEYSFIRRD